MNITLTDDELLDVPLGNLKPGELRHAFQVQASANEKRQERESERDHSTSALQHSQEEAKTSEREEIEQREAALLTRIHEREIEIAEEAERLDRRTIKLDDGRRAYVDGDGYRDAEGRELTGADRAQAEVHQLEQPDAATWREHQDIDAQRQAATQIRKQVEALQQGGSDNVEAIATYERDFRIKVKDRATATAEDSANSDYMAVVRFLKQACNPGCALRQVIQQIGWLELQSLG